MPAALCFSTVGRLWFLPGILLVAGAVLAVGRPSEVRPVLARNWLRALLSVLGGFELLMAVSAAPIVTVVVGIVGGLALVAAPWAPGRRPVRLSLLLLGTLPFMLLTWSSIATPLLAAVALGIGAVVLRRERITGTARPAAVPVGRLRDRHPVQRDRRSACRPARQGDGVVIEARNRHRPLFEQPALFATVMADTVLAGTRPEG